MHAKYELWSESEFWIENENGNIFNFFVFFRSISPYFSVFCMFNGLRCMKITLNNVFVDVMHHIQSYGIIYQVT